MFWNVETEPNTNTYPWLRSSDAFDSNYAWFAFANGGFLFNGVVLKPYVVRPALNLDLSQVEFTVV